jgi:Ca2+-transporting ATPase
MKAVAGSVGLHARLVRQLEGNVETDEDQKDDERIEPNERKHKDDFYMDQTQLNAVLLSSLRTLFGGGI